MCGKVYAVLAGFSVLQTCLSFYFSVLSLHHSGQHGRQAVVLSARANFADLPAAGVQVVKGN